MTICFIRSTLDNGNDLLIYPDRLPVEPNNLIPVRTSYTVNLIEVDITGWYIRSPTYLRLNSVRDIVQTLLRDPSGSGRDLQT